MSKITIREVVRIPYIREYFEPDMIIPGDTIEVLRLWGKDAIGNEREPDSYTMTFIYDESGKQKKWVNIQALWEITELEYNNYKRYCAELDAQKNRPLTSKRK